VDNNKYKFARLKVQEIHEARQLLQAVRQRFQTTFIFPIAELEKDFGELWKHGEEDDTKLSDKDWEYYEKFEQLRKRILDNGNAQLRAMIQELEGFLNKDGK
jgi:hypothetical protein